MRKKIAEKIAEQTRKIWENRGKIAKNREKSYPYISVIIDGTSPKLSCQIALMMSYEHTKFQVKSRQGQGW